MGGPYFEGSAGGTEPFDVLSTPHLAHEQHERRAIGALQARILSVHVVTGRAWSCEVFTHAATAGQSAWAGSWREPNLIMADPPACWRNERDLCFRYGR